jgi:hypothetical protein
MTWALTLKILFFKSWVKPVITPMTTMRTITPTATPMVEMRVDREMKPRVCFTPRSSLMATKVSKKPKGLTSQAAIGERE